MKLAPALLDQTDFERLETLRILIAEDEATQRLMLIRTLERAGYQVEAVGDGQAALERLRTEDFAMLVTDWDMPGLDGTALCREVRCGSIDHYVYIVILTSHDLPTDLVNGLDAGADDYVRKSANPKELVARLAAGARIVRLERSLRSARARIELLSVTDPLLAIYNRRYLTDQLVKEVGRARRHGRPLSVVIADLDHFKLINDLHGHLTGDEVLYGFVKLMKAQLRASDWAARYGGEEFVIVLPETGLDGAAATAEKLRAACAAVPFQTTGGTVTVTASFGVAAVSGAPEGSAPADFSADALLRAADKALYQSKDRGRNRVTVITAGPDSALT